MLYKRCMIYEDVSLDCTRKELSKQLACRGFHHISVFYCFRSPFTYALHQINLLNFSTDELTSWGVHSPRTAPYTPSSLGLCYQDSILAPTLLRTHSWSLATCRIFQDCHAILEILINFSIQQEGWRDFLLSEMAARWLTESCIPKICSESTIFHQYSCQCFLLIRNAQNLVKFRTDSTPAVAQYGIAMQVMPCVTSI